jgi:primosomal protein N' (replication factor Y)
MANLFHPSPAEAFAKAGRFADVILPLAMPQELTYGVPADWDEHLEPGMRVEVALGRNKTYSGIISRLHNDRPELYEVKPLRSVLDDHPVVTQTQLQFWKWISEYYVSSPGEVMNAALPAHLKLSAETRLQWLNPEDQPEWSEYAEPAIAALRQHGVVTISQLRELVGRRYFIAVLNELLEAESISVNDKLEPAYKPKTEKVLSLNPEFASDEAMGALFDKLSRAPKQLETLMSFLVQSARDGGSIAQAKLLEAEAKTSVTAIRALIERDVLRASDKVVGRLPENDLDELRNVHFTEAQQKAYNLLNEKLPEKKVVLLQGVTGSGKTLLYIEKIRACLAEGKQALLLLPEIGLTTQLVRRLYAYFGSELGVYHSKFSNNERVEIWEKVAKGNYKIVVGPRSALWLPYQTLGLIVCDEEHDGSYKQRDPAPRFHARDAAIYLANLHQAEVILGSATPSLESLYNVQQGKYGHVPLKERYQGLDMPTIELVDARSINPKEVFSILTPALQQAMQKALFEEKQVILFQNRRGYAPFLICLSCGWVPHCPHCAVSLTYHKASDQTRCHYCGYHQNPPLQCIYCGSDRIKSRSYGTEKIEEEVKTAFPDARVARMDNDTMQGKNALSALLDRMENRQIDILVGTQMVVKGLDFAPVALVAILSSDSLLSFPDFRTNERAFQLMEQVSGRAGRADGKGRVLIQGYDLKHPVLHWVSDHDVKSCYMHEIEHRQAFDYPPFCRMIKVNFRHKEEQKAQEAGQFFAQGISAIEGIQVQGPTPALVARVRDQYIQEIWLKCPRNPTLLAEVKKRLRVVRSQIAAQKGFSDLQVIIDVDPQ